MSAGLTSSSPANRSLESAKAAKRDEFYTQLADIENELKHYRVHFAGKVVLCNCDDPFESNFFKYFALNFKTLGLKKLICTSYEGSPIAGGQLPFEEYAGHKPNGKQARLVEINKVPDLNSDGAIDLLDVEHLLRHDANTSRRIHGDNEYGGGDFRSSECVEALTQADIVVTNPPFSLFRVYVAQLIKHRKKFLIIGPKNAPTYKDFFKFVQENMLWLGVGFAAGNAYFKIPSENARDYADGVYDETTGMVKFRNVGWFTNMDHNKRHEELPLFKRYSRDEYPTYANFDGIDVTHLADIPVDYAGAMGVPLTFLDNHNPDQFDILGSSMTLSRPMSQVAPKGTYVQGGPRFYLANGDGTYRRLFDKIVIQRKP